MRHLLSIPLLLAASTAFAQPRADVWSRPRPVAQPEECGVTFVRAPDDARESIERYLRDEPRCTSSIDLRVVPTDGGYYLMAQRVDGRIHERIVPDLQSAGVLVASWIADDWISPPPPPSVAPDPRPVVTELAPPSAAPMPRTGVVASASPPDRKRHQWLTLGFGVQPDGDGAGLRFEADVATAGAWRLGGIATYSAHISRYAGVDWMTSSLRARDIQAMAQLSRTSSFGRWDLRLAIGAGIINTHITGWGEQWSSSGFTTFEETDTFGVGEASALVTRRIGRSWGIGVGPVLTILSESFQDSQTGAAIERNTAQFELFGGVRYEL